MDITEKAKEFGFVLLVFGIITFFMRPVYFSCDSNKMTCSSYQIPGAKQTIKIEDIKGCSCGTYDEIYTPSSESRKRRNLRKLGFDYQTKKRTVQREYLNLTFDEHNEFKYRKLDMKKIQGFTCGDIDKLCSQITNKETFTFKSNKYYHDVFNFWYLYIILGCLGIFLSKKLPK